MKILRNASLKHILLSCGLSVLSMQAAAHDIYIWPSYFTLNSEKPTSVPVDITASHTTFRPDFAMPSAGVEVFGVDGKKVRRVGSYFEGARRATFDLAVEEQGTYFLTYSPKPSYFTSYQIGRSDEPKHMRANKSDAKKKLPKKAKKVKTSRYSTFAMSYVTNKAPTEAVLEPKKEGFELVPQTHPSDYVTGEDLVVSLLYDGKPASNLDVVIEQEGPQYKAEPVVLKLKSDKKGLVTFNLEEGGRYMLKVNHERDSDDPEADVAITRIFYAFEAIYE